MHTLPVTPLPVTRATPPLPAHLVTLPAIAPQSRHNARHCIDGGRGILTPGAIAPPAATAGHRLTPGRGQQGGGWGACGGVNLTAIV